MPIYVILCIYLFVGGWAGETKTAKKRRMRLEEERWCLRIPDGLKLSLLNICCTDVIYVCICLCCNMKVSCFTVLELTFNHGGDLVSM